MTTAFGDNPGRPLRAVYGPEDARRVREALDQERGLWRAFLKAKGALLGALATVGDLAGSTWIRLQDNRLLRYAARALGWSLHAVGQARQILARPGVGSGLLWAALTDTGVRIISTSASVLAGVTRRVFGPVARASGWLLRHAGRPGQWFSSNIETLVDVLSDRVRAIGEELAATVGPFLCIDGIVVQSVRTYLAARSLSGLAASMLPKPWQLLARAAASVAALPAGVRRSAYAFLRDLLTSHTTENPTPPQAGPVAAAPAPQDSGPGRNVKSPVAEVTYLAAERPQRQDPDVADLDEAVPSLQRYPAKKAAQRRR